MTVATRVSSSSKDTTSGDLVGSSRTTNEQSPMVKQALPAFQIDGQPSSSDSILSISSSTGSDSGAKKKPGFQIMGLDPSPELLAIAMGGWEG